MFLLSFVLSTTYTTSVVAQSLTPHPDLIKTALPIVGGIGTSVLSTIITAMVKNLISDPRSNLKTDLEILKLLTSTDPVYETLKGQIVASIESIYLESGKSAELKLGNMKIYGLKDFLLGFVLLLLFSIWTIFLSINGFSWWSLLTGFFALGGIGGISNSLDKEYQERKERERKAKRRET